MGRLRFPRHALRLRRSISLRGGAGREVKPGLGRPSAEAEPSPLNAVTRGLPLTRPPHFTLKWTLIRDVEEGEHPGQGGESLEA